MYSLQLFTTIR